MFEALNLEIPEFKLLFVVQRGVQVQKGKQINKNAFVQDKKIK